MMTIPAAAFTPAAAKPLKPWRQRPALHTETLVLLCVSFLLLAGNGPFWRAALAGRGW